jgi:hypothetical protein
VSKRVQTHLRHNLVGYLALFVALAGTSYAAIALPPNSVGSRQIKPNAVRSSDVRDAALLAKDFRPGELPAGPKGDPGPPGPKGDPGIVDTSAFYDKATSDARFLEVRTLDFNANVGTTKGFDFGTIHLEAGCTATGGAQMLVKGSSTAPVIASSSYTDSARGGGTTIPLAGRQVLSGSLSNLFFADNDRQEDGIFLFRTAGKVITMTFHASATTFDNTCELHAAITEPHADPFG